MCLKKSGSYSQHSCATSLMKQVALECGMAPCLLVSNPLASAHSEGEWTGHFGARITNCPCGDGYQGQQHRSNTSITVLANIFGE